MSWYRATLFLPLLLAACGFNARGTIDLPPAMTVVYVDSPNQFSDFYRALVTEIRGSRLTLADSAGEADTIIQISEDVTGKRVLSVSARNIPTEYEVYYTVRFAVLMDGEEVLPPKRHTRIREYTYDETLVLGKALEEEVIRKSIADDLVGLVVQHISAIS